MTSCNFNRIQRKKIPSLSFFFFFFFFYCCQNPVGGSRVQVFLARWDFSVLKLAKSWADWDKWVTSESHNRSLVTAWLDLTASSFSHPPNGVVIATPADSMQVWKLFSPRKRSLLLMPLLSLVHFPQNTLPVTSEGVEVSALWSGRPCLVAGEAPLRNGRWLPAKSMWAADHWALGGVTVLAVCWCVPYTPGRAAVGTARGWRQLWDAAIWIDAARKRGRVTGSGSLES